MKLHFKKLGQGYPILILHGLYGSSDNWITIGRELAKYLEVYLIDMRNHGQSEHSPTHNYQSMSADIYEFIITNNINKPAIIGHSMGGKAALEFAYRYPMHIHKLIIADIAPRNYLIDKDLPENMENHEQIISILSAINLNLYKGRDEIDQELTKFIHDRKLRAFLLKNISRTTSNFFEWKINLPAIEKNLENILKGIDYDATKLKGIKYRFPVLFVKGKNSDYISTNDIENIKEIFVYSKFSEIENAGHWLHAEQPEAFIKAVKKFILE